MGINQIQQRKEENPNDIDEVPVESDHLDGRVPLGSVGSSIGFDDQEEQESGADDHVKSVESGHGEVESEVKAGMRHIHACGPVMRMEIGTGDFVMDEL